MTGAEVWTTTGIQSAILLAWLGLGVWFVRNNFRWEPRG